MLTDQEIISLTTSINKAIDMANRMKSLITNIESKRDIVEKIIILQTPSIDKTHVSCQISSLINLIGKIDVFIENISVIKNIDKNIPDVFKNFIQKEIILYNWDNQIITSRFTINSINCFLAKQSTEDLNINSEDNNTIIWICTLTENYINIVSSLEKKLSTYKMFDKIKWIDNNIVMIGANGSGKSTFSRYLNGKIASNISILSAQHLLVYNKKDNIPASNAEITNLRSFQKNSKMSSDSNFASLIGNDMDKLITTLIAEHTDRALEYYNSHAHQRKNSFLEKTIEIWEELIEHRKLLIERGFISAQIPEQKIYSFNSLSDGEKAVFYYIGHILLVEPNSYIIIDEPENHLHVAICNKLWDKLEQIRSDCKFIYLTHNLDFAATRTNTTLIWNKKFMPPDIWDFQIIESNEILPDTLLMEVLGSRKKICFCEGKDKSCLDYKLYSALFPEYTVIPVGGHLNVINYTIACNRSTFSLNQVIGIIDGDCHKEEQISKWESQHIYTIPANEIENILCDLNIIKKAIYTFKSGENALQNYLNLFWEEFENNKDQQAVWYINNIINNKFKENFLHEKKNISNLKLELRSITSEKEIDELYTERLTNIENIIKNKIYDDALFIVNFKGKLTKHIAKNTIVDRYPDRILELIRTDDELKNLIKSKYFSKLS